MDWSAKKTHFQLSAWFNALYGLFNLSGALLFFVVFGGFGLLFGGIGFATLQIPLVFGGGFFLFFGLVIAGLVAIPFVMNLIAAVGLAWFPDELWTVVVGVVAAMMSLPIFPHGTLLGMHTMFVVFWDPLTQAATSSRSPGT